MQSFSSCSQSEVHYFVKLFSALKSTKSFSYLCVMVCVFFVVVFGWLVGFLFCFLSFLMLKSCSHSM